MIIITNIPLKKKNEQDLSSPEYGIQLNLDHPNFII